jgi:hypothetical protein
LKSFERTRASARIKVRSRRIICAVAFDTYEKSSSTNLVLTPSGVYCHQYTTNILTRCREDVVAQPVYYFVNFNRRKTPEKVSTPHDKYFLLVYSSGDEVRLTVCGLSLQGHKPQYAPVDDPDTEKPEGARFSPEKSLFVILLSGVAVLTTS